MAAPAWRQFSFFQSTPCPSSAASPHLDLIQHPALLSTLHASADLGDGFVLAADLEGNLHWLSEGWDADRSWKAYERGRVQLVQSAEWDLRRGWVIVVTVGDESSTPFPALKVWLLTLPTPATADSPDATLPHLTLLRAAPISPTPSRPSPVSSLALAPSLSHIVVGLADGSVVGFKRVADLVEASLLDLEDYAARAAEPGASAAKARAFAPGGMGKLRVLWEGNKEPVTNVGITAAAPASAEQTLFILTTSQILALPLPADKSSRSAKSAQPALLDELGAAVGCAKVLRLGVGKGAEDEGATGERMVVAREEAIYVYGADGREGCWAYEGPKSSIIPLHASSVAPSASTAPHLLPTPYLAIISPPQSSSLASTSATIRAHARASPAQAQAGAEAGTGEEHVAKVTVFDPENKFVAFSGTYAGEEGGVRDVVEAWDAVWVLTEGGKLFRLTEQPLESLFATLFQRNLYTLAISLAHSRGLGADQIAESYRRYGDHLYAKADYEGAMAAYLKTVGTVQASYVIRKFLDAQRLTHLTSYLQELHSRGLANSDITTLLLNCYTKLADDDALSRFIHSSSSSSSSGEADEPPFDLDTAIRVLRQAGYFAHASWLAERYRAHGAFLRIAIEDAGDCVGALRYVRALAARGGEDGAADEARESLQRWGGVLLAKEPELTTEVLVEICCGVEEPKANGTSGAKEKERSKESATAAKDRVATLKSGSASSGAQSATRAASMGYDVPDAPTASVVASPSPDGASFVATAEPESTLPSLPSPRSFFAHFVNHPRHFISFLEAVAARRYGKRVDALVPPAALTGTDAPLPAPRALDVEAPRDAAARDEQVVWNTLLELYVSPLADADEAERAALQGKALRLLRCREQVPYDETQALLVCTTQGFEEGFVLLYELLGMYEDIVRYWTDAATASPSAPDHTSRILRALRRYGSSCPSLYRLVLQHLTTSSDLLSRHQADVVDLLDEIDREKVLPPIAIVQLLSANGNASVGLVRECLKRQLLAEKQETDSDLALIASYRTETAKKRREVVELSDPDAPRVFQVTRCSACGGQLDLPGVHFMCRHSYHQRCLGENESQCPNCARTHGVVREIRRNNEQLRGRHDLFVEEVAGAEDPFAAVAGAFARGWMGGEGEA
ncbi:Vacuolar protein sorting-associated protein 11 [Rhodotorula kratochvilovae]